MNWFQRVGLNLMLKIGGKKVIKKLQELLVGKKSYMASVGLLITSLIEFSTDGDVSKLIQRIFECIAISGIRAAIK